LDLERLAALLRKYLMVAGGVALLALVLLATANVALRIVHAPVSGTYEVVSFLGAIVTAGALGYTQKRKDHIVVDILSGKFPGPVRRALDGVSYAVTTALFAVVSWQTFDWGRRLQQTGELSETLKIASYPFVFCVSLGFGVLALTLFLDLLSVLLPKEGPS